jgi:hypothetical protein
MSLWTVELPCHPAAASGDAGADAGAVGTGWCAPEACNAECQALCLAANPFWDGGPAVVPDICQLEVVGTSLVAECQYYTTGCGRPPRGFVARRASACSASPGSAARLAEMAQLEAASVGAFRALRSDLARLGAPKRLLCAVRLATRDEVRHARVVGRAAERFGARVPATRMGPMARRSLLQLAIENAEEGCVRETFGAALAAVQAERAGDRRVRRMMRAVARDELDHAALSWRIAEWLEARLDAQGRARVNEARVAALAMLESELARDQPGDDVLGLPDTRGARAVLAGLREALRSGDLRSSVAANGE